MLIAQGTFTIYLAFQIVAAIHGTGRHRSDLSDADTRTALMVRSVHRYCFSASLTLEQFWYLCELLYVLANCLLKVSHRDSPHVRDRFLILRSFLSDISTSGLLSRSGKSGPSDFYSLVQVRTPGKRNMPLLMSRSVSYSAFRIDILLPSHVPMHS